MRDTFMVLQGGLVLALVVGCIPEKRVVWSPDGTRALVRMGENRLCVLEGAALTARDLGLRAHGASWLPDGRRAVATVINEYADWEKLRGVLRPEELEEVTAAAKRLGEAILAFKGPMEKFKGEDLLPKNGAAALAALVCLRDTASAELRGKLGSKWDDMHTIKATTCQIAVIDTTGGQREGETPGGSAVVQAGPELLLQDVRPFVDPTGRAVAVLLPRAEQDVTEQDPAYALGLCDVGSSDAPRIVDERVGYELAWRADGKQVAYLQYAGQPPKEKEEQERLGFLVTRDIAYEPTGSLAAEQPGTSEPIVVIFHSFSDLHYAGDGTLFFACKAAELPATKQDVPAGWGVFCWDEQRPGTLKRVLSREDAAWFDKPAELGWFFALSPSGQRLLLSGKEKLYVCDVRSGKRAVVEGIHADAHGVAPVWRNEKEFAVVVVPGDERGSAHRSELVLVGLDEAGEPKSYTCLSREWPDEWVNEWFESKAAQTQPATQPSEK
jgi:hypothetical protein